MIGFDPCLRRLDEMLWIRRVVVALVVQGCRVTETVSYGAIFTSPPLGYA